MLSTCHVLFIVVDKINGIHLSKGLPLPPMILDANSTYPDTISLTLVEEETGVGLPPHSFGFEIQPYLHNTSGNTSGNATDAPIPLEVRMVLFPDYEDNDNVTVDINELTPGQNYSFGVRAFNKFGVSGPFSDVVSDVITAEFQGTFVCVYVCAHVSVFQVHYKSL